MTLIKHTQPNMIIADEGKHIRSINDVYAVAYTDEEGNYIEEHFPHYATVIFVPNDFTEEQMNELYIAEEVGE
jgi:hypothetical protein